MALRNLVDHGLWAFAVDKRAKSRITGFDRMSKCNPGIPHAAHAVAAPRRPNAWATSSPDGRSRPCRSATVHATRRMRSGPRRLRELRSTSSSTSAPDGSGKKRVRNSPVGIRALTCHGDPRKRRAERSRACSTLSRTVADDSAGLGSLSSASTGLRRLTRTSTRSINGPDKRAA